MRTIFHIANTEEYNTALASGGGKYKPAAFDHEGFIHCSTADQLSGTLDKHFKAIDKVLLLAIDAEVEKDHLRFEDLYGSGQDFPHIYRELLLTSVPDTIFLERNESGVFDIPDEWIERYR